MTTLWSQPVKRDEPAMPMRGYTLRDFQQEDVEAVEASWDQGHTGVLCVWATGLGKSVGAAEIAARKPEGKRAFIIVDSSNLAKDLYRTLIRHTGDLPGILTGELKSRWEDAGIVVATKQCLCAMNGDDPFYAGVDWMRVDRVVVDECEAALADGYAAMMVHMMDANPDLRTVGLTATPLPAGNRNIGDLFPHAASEPGPLYRDLQWAYLNGWLVKPKQAMVRTSMDFSTVTVSKNAMGEADYSEADLARLLMDQDEREWIELGNAIYQVAKGHTAIVVCPNSTDVADKLCGYIEGAGRHEGKRDVAYSIHRSLGHKESSDRMERFTDGEFPIAVSVKMFEKGFDYDCVDMVVMVRRTKSLRLYTQAAGRGTRPLTAIRPALADAKSAEERMQIIRESAKPHCVIVDCVGINDQAKDILGVIDILGRGVPADIRERVRQNQLEQAMNQPEPGSFEDEESADKPKQEREDGDDVGDAAREAVRQMNEERERRARLAAKVDVHYEETDGRKYTGHTAQTSQRPARGSSSIRQVALLVGHGFSWDDALRTSKKQAGKIISDKKEAGEKPDWKTWRSALKQMEGWPREGGA